MMVTLQVSVETGRFTACTERCDQPKIIQHPECPIDGIKRDCRYTVPDTLENLIGIWMIPCLRNFTKNFHPLMRQLDSFVTADRLEVFHSQLDFLLLDFHNHSPFKN